MSADRPTAVSVERVSKSFGTKEVLHDVSFNVATGEALCILGRSGTGKSVTLKLIIALLRPDTGRIFIGQDDITTLKTEGLSRVRRKMGFLFQDAALFDSVTLDENLALPLLRLTNKSPEEIEFNVDKVLRQVGLAFDKKPMPSDLSGGMRKRAGRWHARWCSSQRFCWRTNQPAAWTGSRQQKLTSCCYNKRSSVRRPSSSLLMMCMAPGA
jgi:phospholipid/cholesterol/gamma-HCH transport system ATP-binding protein